MRFDIHERLSMAETPNGAAYCDANVFQEEVENTVYPNVGIYLVTAHESCPAVNELIGQSCGLEGSFLIDFAPAS